MKVQFGALTPPLAEQIPALADPVNDEARTLQRYADAITLLAIGGLLSESETRRARRRLLAKIREVCS